MNQREISIEGNQLRTVGLRRIIPILFGLMIFRSVLSQDFVFMATPRADWVSVVCSADGTKLAAFAADESYYAPWRSKGLYVSSDSGATWRNPSPWLTRCDSLALTPNADTLVALGPGILYYISHDLGITWNTNLSPTAPLQIAFSADGTKWVCAFNGNSPFSGTSAIYISDDSGVSWEATSAPVTRWNSVACSGDGSHLAAVQGTGQVFTSQNRGVTWQSQIPASATNSFNLIVCSVDGNKLVALGDLVCVSTNAGASWTTVGSQPPAEPDVTYIGGLRPLDRISASTDATRLVAVRSYNDFLWTSTNSGAEWVLHGEDPQRAGIGFLGVACSADGSRWFAAAGEFPYTWPPPPVALSISLQGTNLTLSWPSNQFGFALEQTASLSPGAKWTPVTNEVFQGNYQFVVRPSPGTQSGYYRLHKQ